MLISDPQQVPKCMSCHKAMMVIRRAHCFHDYMYIMPILLLWELTILCVMDHLLLDDWFLKNVFLKKLLIDILISRHKKLIYIHIYTLCAYAPSPLLIRALRAFTFINKRLMPLFLVLCCFNWKVRYLCFVCALQLNIHSHLSPLFYFTI